MKRPMLPAAVAAAVMMTVLVEVAAAPLQNVDNSEIAESAVSRPVSLVFCWGWLQVEAHLEVGLALCPGPSLPHSPTPPTFQTSWSVHRKIPRENGSVWSQQPLLTQLVRDAI